MRTGYVSFPQGNVPAEPQPLPDSERIPEELRLLELAGTLGFEELWTTEHHFGDYNLAPPRCSCSPGPPAASPE